MALILACLPLVLGCGGGGGPSSPPPPQPPASLAYPLVDAVFTRGAAIAPLLPTIAGGTVTTYAVAPDLPASLELNPATGAIEGTPTALSPAALYAVTASNAAGSVTVSLNLTVNDQAPVISFGAPVTCTVGLALPPLQPALAGGPALSWSITPGLPEGMALNPETGVIQGAPSAAAPATTYTVTANNSGGSGSAPLTLTVIDTTPAPAYATQNLACTLNVPIVPDLAENTGGAATWTIAPPLPQGLVLDPATGIIQGTPTELQATQSYTVTAQNSGGQVSIQLTLAVLPPPPVALTYNPASATLTTGAPAPALVPLLTPPGLPVTYTATGLPPNLAIDPVTGLITGMPAAAAAAAACTVTVRNDGGSASFQVILAVVDPAPTALVYPEPSATFTQGLAITPQSPAFTGASPASYGVSPPLPAGLDLDASGTLSGTPTTVTGPGSYTVTATGADSVTATAILTLTVAGAPPNSLAYPASILAFTTGAPIPQQVPTVTSLSPVLFSVAPPLPQGLTLDSATGIIEGTPTLASAQQRYAVTARNGSGSTSVQIQISVADPAPAGLAYPSPTAAYLRGVTIPPQTPRLPVGGPATYTVAPALPQGLGIDSAGTLSGTPIAATAQAAYTVAATTGAGSVSTTLILSVYEDPPTALAYPSPVASFTLGGPIPPQTPTLVSPAPVTFSVQPALPPGLSVNAATGLLSGTPTATEAQASYTVTAGNIWGSATANLDLAVVNPPPSALVYPQPTAVFVQGLAIAPQTPSFTGAGPASYAVAPPLPAGLTLDAGTGALSGTPSTATAQAAYSVTATGVNTVTATATLTFTVTGAPPANLIYPASPLAFTTGAPIPQQVPTVASLSPVVFSVAPPLPQGLTLDSATGVIHGTPALASAQQSYTIAAGNGSGSTSAQIQISVADPAPAGLGYPIPTAAYLRGVAIRPQTPTLQVGGPAAYTVAPALPAGLSLSNAGILSGTPTAATAQAAYTVTATTGAGSVSTTLTLSVYEDPPTVLAYPSPVASYTRGGPIPPQDPTLVSPAPVTFSVLSALPPGLSLNAQTGLLSGTPTAAAAQAAYTVTAGNPWGTVTATLTLTVSEAPPSALVYPDPTAVYVKGVPVHQTPSLATALPATFSVTPPLPAGLVLDAGTGALSGTPTTPSAQISCTVTAGNALGSTSAVLHLTVSDVPPLLNYTSPATYTQNLAISANLPNPAGGTVLSWGLAPGSTLPAGLALDPASGSITGTPTALAARTTVTVEAAYTGGISTGNVVITVVAAPVITSFLPSATALVLGQSLTLTPVFSGGTGLIVPPPPGGQQVASGTALTYTPSADTTYTLTVSNAAGVAAPAATVAIQVRTQAIAITTFTASPTQVVFGQNSNLAWVLDGTPSTLTLEDNLTGAAPADMLGETGRNAMPILRRQTFTLKVTDALGDNTRAVTVAARGLDDLAGDFGGPGSINGNTNAGPQPHARFNGPGGVAADAAGNLYVADTQNHTIRLITPQGGVSLLAGLAGFPGLNDDTGGLARFDQPQGIVVDAAGQNLYLADTGNNAIRSITAQGVVSTLAGNGSAGSADGSGAAAEFDAPCALALDGTGQNLYVADRNNRVVRVVSLAGDVSTLHLPLGLVAPAGVAVATNGAGQEHVYVSDSANQVILDIPAAQPGGTVILAGARGVAGAVDNPVGTSARFNGPAGLVPDGQGNLLVADRGNDTLRQVTLAGAVTTMAGLAGTPGSGDGAGAAARFSNPQAAAVTAAGTVYVADTGNNSIRAVAPISQAVTTLAGSAVLPDGLLDGAGPAARFFNPIGIAVDPDGDAFVADSGNNVIRKVTLAGAVQTWAGSLARNPGDRDGLGDAAQFDDPQDVAADGAGNLFVVDSGNFTIRRIAPDRTVTLLAGAPGTPGHQDGPALGGALFEAPTSIALDSAGNLYVGEGNCIRKITPAGAVSTLAGDPGATGYRNAIGAAALFQDLQGLAVDGGGNLFVADTGNHVIRRVATDGTVSTFAGQARTPGQLDGPPGTARLNEPFHLAFGPNGALYVTELGNPDLRVIAADGSSVTTLVGGDLSGPVDPGPLTLGGARMNLGRGIAFTPSGDLLMVFGRFPGNPAGATGIVQVTAP